MDGGSLLPAIVYTPLQAPPNGMAAKTMPQTLAEHQLTKFWFRHFSREVEINSP